MSEWDCGIFECGMAWASFGSGPKIALVMPGGPGNPEPPIGRAGASEIKAFLPLVDKGFRIVTVSRKQNMPKGHSCIDMAKDYADMIANEFGGEVDLVIGVSFGGMIGQYLAANHADCFKHIVLLVSAWKVNERTKKIDVTYAKLMSEGKSFRAGKVYGEGIFSKMTPALAGLFLGALLWLGAFKKPHKFFSSDIMVDVEAEIEFDSRVALGQIKVPVLLIAGDNDFWFSKDLLLQTAEMIPDCRLRIYEAKGHLEAVTDPRVSSDIIEFLSI